MVIVGSDRWEFPYSTMTPIPPFTLRKSGSVDSSYSWFPKHVDILKFVNRTIRESRPFAVFPCGVLDPYSSVIWIETGRFSPTLYQTTDNFYSRLRFVFSTTNIVSIQSPIDCLLTATK